MPVVWQCCLALYSRVFVKRGATACGGFGGERGRAVRRGAAAHAVARVGARRRIGSPWCARGGVPRRRRAWVCGGIGDRAPRRRFAAATARCGAPRRALRRSLRRALKRVAARCAVPRRHGVPRRTAPRRAAAVARTCVGANSLCNWHGKCFTSDNAHKYSPLNIITCNWLTTVVCV